MPIIDIKSFKQGGKGKISNGWNLLYK